LSTACCQSPDTMFHDLADSPRASSCDHPADHVLEALCPRCRHPVDAVCPACGSNVEASGADNGKEQMANGTLVSVLTPEEFYRRFVLLVHNARNSKFTLGCYLIATGSGFADGVSMTDYAREWGVRKATVSKQCRYICGYLGIPPSRYMREEGVAAKFKLSNRRPRKV
jgi:hypothetical protein